MLMFTLLLLTTFQSCAPTAIYDSDGLQRAPDALKPAGDVCQDCTKIFELLDDMLSSSSLQKKLMDGIDQVCALLPGPAATLCKSEVDKILPVAITFMTGVTKPEQMCKILGLCGSGDKSEKMLSYFIDVALKAAVQGDNARGSTECTFCIFLVKTLEDLLPAERTEDAVTKLLEDVCHIVPVAYHSQCVTVVDKFSKEVMDAIVHYATPQNVCTLMQMCNRQEADVVDPCSMTTYSCRDMRTALQCGTLFYCQKFAWKPLSDDAL